MIAQWCHNYRSINSSFVNITVLLMCCLIGFALWIHPSKFKVYLLTNQAGSQLYASSVAGFLKCLSIACSGKDLDISILLSSSFVLVPFDLLWVEVVAKVFSTWIILLWVKDPLSCYGKFNIHFKPYEAKFFDPAPTLMAFTGVTNAHWPSPHPHPSQQHAGLNHAV